MSDETFDQIFMLAVILAIAGIIGGVILTMPTGHGEIQVIEPAAAPKLDMQQQPNPYIQKDSGRWT